MLPPAIHKEIKKHKRAMVYADCARPDTIEQIKKMGSSIIGLPKKEIVYGIELLQEYDMLVTSNSLNLIKELRKYVWIENKHGLKVNVPIDAYNHLLDALRYVAVEVLGIKKRKFMSARA